MKKQFYIIILFLLIGISLSAQQKSYKRGVSYQIPYKEDVVSMAPGISWYYNWGTSPANAITSELLNEYEVDFLPMAWNGYYNETAIRNYLSTHANVKYLLGFNEPNFKEQANMTPAEAAGKWKDLEKIADDFGLKLVAPAVNYSPDAPYNDPINYLDDFFKECKDCRVDYIAVHCYMSYPSALMWYVNRFKKYGKPIWLTEFCAWDNFWEVPGDAAENQLNYMVNAINYLEHDPDVYRYAWFIPRTSGSDKWPYMQFLEDNKPGELTKLGKVFVNMSSQDKSHFFSIGERIQAEHYTSMNIADVPNSDNWQSSILLEPTNDETGILNIWDFKDNRWVDYNIDVPIAGDYNLSMRILSDVKANCSVSVNGFETGLYIFESTNNKWETIDRQINLSAGKQTIRFKVVSGNIKLNWFSLINEGSSISQNPAKNIKIYPNPVTDIMNIVSEVTPQKINLFNLQGEKMAEVFNTLSVNMSNLPNGIYIAKVELAKDDVKTLSVIKQ